MSSRAGRVALALWLPLTLVALWWVLSANSTSFYFPPLSTIVDTFVDTWFSSRFRADVIPSLWRFLLGMVIATMLGIGLGTVLGRASKLRRAFEPILDFFRSLPKPALLPLAIVVFGVEDSMKVFMIAFAALWPILLNTIDGVRAVDPLLLDMSRVYGLTRRQRVVQLVLPSATPQIMVGVRISLSIGLIVMVIAEMVASTNGVGYFLLLSQQTFAIPEMWAGILLLGLIGYVVNLIFVLVENRVLAWHRGWRATARGESPEQPKARPRSAKSATAA